MERNQYIPGITRMDLRHLRYFVAVAEERHFTRAAERLGIKQPPLSLQIKQLEQELGTPLFRRLTRGVELTEPGTLLLDEARQILEQVERTKANVRNRARGETGHIRVGFAGAIYFHPRVPRLIQAYRKRYPGVLLSSAEGNMPGGRSLDLVKAVQTGSVDVAFVRLPLEHNEAITIHPLVDETMRIVLPSYHPQARKRSVSLATLAQEKFILFPRAMGPGLYDSVIAGCQRAGFSPILGEEGMQIGSILSLVAAGFGISIVTRSIEQIRVDGIVYVPIRGESPRTAISLAVRKDTRSAVIRNFVALARSRVRAAD
jgi:DNA-binding transcriptional LysR family regulator